MINIDYIDDKVIMSCIKQPTNLIYMKHYMITPVIAEKTKIKTYIMGKYKQNNGTPSKYFKIITYYSMCY